MGDTHDVCQGICPAHRHKIRIEIAGQRQSFRVDIAYQHFSGTGGLVQQGVHQTNWPRADHQYRVAYAGMTTLEGIIDAREGLDKRTFFERDMVRKYHDISLL